VKLISAKEAAAMMSVSVCTVLRLADRGAFPQYKIGGSLRYDMDEILEYIRSSATPVIEPAPRQEQKQKFLYIPGMKVV